MAQEPIEELARRLCDELRAAGGVSTRWQDLDMLAGRLKISADAAKAAAFLAAFNGWVYYQKNTVALAGRAGGDHGPPT